MTNEQNFPKATPNTIYDYETPKHEDSFRVVDLLPGESEGLITCRLREVRLSLNPKFEALSYTWGNAECTKEVHDVDSDVTIAITEKLHDAFKALRRPDEVRTIFVDAIWIHQSLPSEKGHQVAQMAEIYSNASLVVAWLGKDDHETAIRSLQSLARNSTACGLLSVFPVSNQAPAPSELQMMDTVLKDCDILALSKFFANSWFERLWILQELVLARDVVFCSGHNTFTFKEFSQAIGVLGLMLRHLTLRGHGDVESLQQLFYSGDLLRIGGTLQMREHRLFKERVRLGNLSDLDRLYLPDFREFSLAVYCATLIQYKCQNARDRVYGMLSLAQNGLRLRPDYESSPSQVYTDLALESLSSGDLSVLHHGGIRWVNDTMQMPRTATFVADLEDTNIVLPYLGGVGVSRYQAGSQVPSHVELVTYDGKTLPSIRARMISSVEHTKHVGRKDTFLADYMDIDTSKIPPQFTISLSALHDVYDFCKQLSSNKDPVYTEGFDTAFALTVVGNNAIREASWLSGMGVSREDLLSMLFMHMKICNRPGVRDRTYMDADEVIADLSENRDTIDEGQLETWAQHIQAYHNVIRAFLGRRTVFMTPRGYVGLGPNSMVKGDIVVVFEGGETPFVLRPVQAATNAESPMYYIVGDCYLHGWMNGEALSDEAGIPAKQLILI